MQTTKINTVPVERHARNPYRIHKSLSTEKVVRFLGNSNEKRIVLKKPITGLEAKNLYPENLSSRDWKDIKQYENVYYLKKAENTKSTQRENGFIFFNFEKNVHIAYRYEQLRFLGRGSFGTVVKCFDHKTKQEVALKIFYNDEEDRKQINLEVEYLTKLAMHENGSSNHHVIGIIDTFVFRKFFCIVTELNHTNLYSHLKSRHFTPLPSEQVRNIAIQLADALAFTHSANIVHSDIKPENIMFTDSSMSNISIIDFGCACYNEKPLYKVVQSLYYRSPEVIFNFMYNSKIDVWSYGCVLFELATGMPLFRSNNEKELIACISSIVGAPPYEMVVRSKKMQNYFEKKQANRAAYEARKKSYIAEFLGDNNTDLIDLICSCLEWLPAKRPTMQQVLEHPYFKK